MKPEPPILPPPSSAVPAKSKKRRNGLVYLAIGLSLVTLVLVAVFNKRTPPITVQTEKVARRSLTEVVVANARSSRSSRFPSAPWRQ